MLIGLVMLAVLWLGLASPAGQRAAEALSQITWTTEGSHAAMHAEADMVRNCQPGYRISVRATKYVDVCAISGGWGFRPWLKTGGPYGDGETWSERTAYQKASVQSPEELEEYVARNNASQGTKWQLFQRVGNSWIEIPIKP